MFNVRFKRLFYGLVVFSLLFLLSCSLLQHTQYEAVHKSPNDKKDYRYLILPNGLKVLLISDENADLASASMDVFVGSNDDPVHRQGLAHFVEHMLFLGTKKYPEADEYTAFISSHGGANNAFTSTEHTNYYFDVSNSSFPEALDRFAQFFVSPLFDSHYVSRELNAIDAEYKAKIKDDNRRKQAVLKALVNDKHPWRKFSVGNLETLPDKDDTILGDLSAFYRQYYSAKNMALVVTGKESIAQLQQMAEKYFSDIPGKKVKKTTVDQPLFKDGYLPRWVNIQPVKQLKELTLFFPMPDFSEAYEAKPLMLIGHILGHEGKGSLFAYLKKNNWIESLVAGETLAYKGGSAFSLSVNLTNEGLDHQQDIVLAVFEAINRLKREGVPRWVYQELSEINNLSFYYPEDSPPLSRAIQLSNGMHYYPAKDLLQASFMLSQYRPDLINQALSYLTESNVLVSVMAHGFTYVDHTRFYKVPYTVAPFPKKITSTLKNKSENLAIVLPEPNDLLPGDMSIPEVASDSNLPEKVVDEKALALWYKPVVSFATPRASNYFGFQRYYKTPNINTDMALALYVALINDSLDELVYPAYLAGLDFSFYSHARGATLRIEGFSSRQEDLLKSIVGHIKQTQFTQQQFERVKREAIRRVANRKFEQPYRKLLAAWQREMRPQLWSDDDILAALERINLKNVEKVSGSFWHGAKLIALSSGDITQEKAIALSRFLQEGLQKQGEFEKQTPIEIVKLKAPEYRYVKTIYNDFGYLYYWQASDVAVLTQAKWMLLGKVLESRYFHALRTEQQLGYVVFTNYYPLLTVPGIIFVVQSPKADVTKSHRATMDFLKGAFSNFPQLSEVAFENYRSALIEQLLEKPKNLPQETNEYWNELSLGFSFGRKKELIAALEKVDFDTWKSEMLGAYASLPERSLLLGTQKRLDTGNDIKPFKANAPSREKYLFSR